MSFKSIALLATGLFIVQTSVYARQNEAAISGLVKDGTGKAVELATVSLWTAKDSVLVKSTFTESNGGFSFNLLKPGSYQVRVSLMGYLNYRSSIVELKNGQDKVSGLDIELVAAVKNLKEVSITSAKAFIERKIDRTVVNVDALISNAGSNALEVLEKSPGVQVDQNGTISLKGKQGVTIFIDDKPTYLSGADLQSYLQSLPSSALEQIEIMTNPPAKYDAAGNGGVINIKTKKGKTKGFNGTLNLGLTQGQLTRSNNSFNFNYRNNKFNFFGMISHNLNNSFNDLDISRSYLNPDQSIQSYFNQNSYFKRHGNTLNAKIGADYYQSERTTWGLVLTGMDRKSTQINDNTSNLLNAAAALDSIIVAANRDVIDFKNKGLNLNYRHTFKQPGTDITVDGDYLSYRNFTDQVYDNFSYFPDRSLKSTDRLSGTLPANTDIYSLKTDYSKALTSGIKLGTGLKSSFTKTDNTADYFNTVDDVTRPDYDKSNHFVYKENINSAYLNLSREGKAISVQAGLRVEHTISDGHQFGNIMKPDSTFRRTYTGLFPTFYISYKLDSLSNNQIGLNYGRRIDRPYYQDLNPFLSPLDKFTYYLGNPFLKPSYTNSVELNHIYKSFITTTLSYSNTKDEVNETIQILDGTYYSKPANIGKSEKISLSANGSYNSLNWLKMNLYAEVTQIHSVSDFYTGKLDTKGTFCYIGPLFQFIFKSGWSAELAGSYQSKVVNAQFIAGSVKQARFAAMKKLSRAASVKMAVGDIFYTRVNSGVINNLANTKANYSSKNDSRSVTLSFNYAFGRTMSDLRKHDATGAEQEQSRVKN